MKNLLSRAMIMLAAWNTAVGGNAANATENPFTVAIIPDSQGLVALANQQDWLQQCQWIVDNKTTRNIKAAIHVGDLVNEWDQLYQWTNVVVGLNLIRDAGIPVIIAPGNHDVDTNGTPQAMTTLTRYLPQSWFTSNANWVGGFLDTTNLAGSYLLVSNAPTTYLVVALAWVPDDRSVNWGRAIMEQFSNCPAIFVLHCFTDDSAWGRRAGWTQRYGIERTFGDQGPWWTPNRLWNEWLHKSKNLFWVISGHLTTENNSMYFQELAEDGHVVTQSLCDYQGIYCCGGGANHGIMQLLTVNPEQNQCHIETFDVGSTKVFTNWNENYNFPLYSTSLTYTSRWQQAQAAVTNGLILWNGFDRTNRDGFVGLSPYRVPLTGTVVVAEGGIYFNSYPAFSNMVAAADIDALTGLSNITISVWFKGTNMPPAGLGIIAGKFLASTTGEWYLGTYGGTRLRLALVNTNNVRITLDSTPVPVNDGNWHYIVVTYDGSIARIYFDGEVVGSMPYSGRLKGTRYAVCFGGLDGQGSPSASATTPWGWLDRAKIWNRALPFEQIETDYARDLATLLAYRTNSANNHLGTNGADIITQPGEQYVLRFAVAGDPTVPIQQRMIVDWDKNPVADVSLILTNVPGPTNWTYTTVLVSSTNVVAKLKSASIVGDSTSSASTNAGIGPALADVNVVPFSRPVVSPLAFTSVTNVTLNMSAYPGLAYQLQASSNLIDWTPASRWVVATGTNVIFTAARGSTPKRYYRVQLKW